MKEMKGGRLRFGGSTSASTAGVLACQWNKAPLNPFAAAKTLTGSRTKSAEEILSRKERKDRKEIFKTSRTSSASPRLRVRFTRASRTLAP